MMKFKFFIVVAGLLLSNIVYAQEAVRGVVYEDTNLNGKRDRREKGIANVGVSNGVDVVLTDASGRYHLPVRENSVFFVIKPDGYRLPVNEHHAPQFFYIHKPDGSPTLKYEGSKPTGGLPKSLDFALLRDTAGSKEFSALIFGDPQAYNIEQIDFFHKGIVKDIKNAKKHTFGISLGDLVGDDLTLHKPYKKAIGDIGIPWFNVIGNHDLNYDVKTDELSDETFEKNFGPTTFSFNQGDAHFIILDNVLYPNPKTGKGYIGGFREDQLDFVENNLRFVPKDKLIVLAFHIPLRSAFRSEDRQRLFDLLKEYPHTFSLSAHSHLQRHNFYGKEHGWHRDAPLHEYNVGTTSGDWYSGLKNEDGVPDATMRDGTPKGYAILNVSGNRYSVDYQVAGKPADYQISLVFPAAVSRLHVRRYRLYANFFIGTETDLVEYSLDGKKWIRMKHELMQDPSHQYRRLQFMNADTLMNGIIPSIVRTSTHIWQAQLPRGLKAGNYVIQVRATDMFGKTHFQTKELKIVE